MVTPKPEKKPEAEAIPQEMTFEQVYILFYFLVKQNHIQAKNQGVKAPSIAFDLRAFKSLPKKIEVCFEKVDGSLLAFIPEKPSDRKRKKPSLLYLPNRNIIKP